MNALVLIVGLAMTGFWVHANEFDCGSGLTEASPAGAYLIHYDFAQTPTRPEVTDDVEKEYATAYEKFEAKDLMPFLRRNFPSALERVRLFPYPSENSVIVVFPEDRTPIVAAVKAFERTKLNAVNKVVVHPRDESFSEPERLPSDDPSEYRDFLLVYQSSLQHQDGVAAFERLNAEFVAKDLKPWLRQVFPDLADKIEITAFPQINSVNLRFPPNAIPALTKVKEVELLLLQTVSAVEVFNGP